MPTDAPFELLAETFAQDTPREPEPTLTLDYTDRSFTRPTSRRERTLRAHAATLATRDTTPTLTD